MNKRIKIKKGIWHKECDCRCNNFRRILRGNALSVFGCKNCNLGIDEDEEIQEYTYREEAIKTMYKERVVKPIINAMKNHNYRNIILPICVPGVKIKDIDAEFIIRQLGYNFEFNPKKYGNDKKELKQHIELLKEIKYK